MMNSYIVSILNKCNQGKIKNNLKSLKIDIEKIWVEKDI